MAKKEKIDALVPVEEQPYPVPENWRWVRLGAAYTISPKVIADDNAIAAFVPMEKISPGFEDFFTFEEQPWHKAKKGHTQFADGDVAFAKISPCFENHKSMTINGLPNGIGGGTTELIILRQPNINQKFTYWIINTEGFIKGGCATYSGTVGQQRISMDYVRNYPVPLPQFPEQQRIVDRIESLFAKLDEAKEKAQAVVDGFEDRKAAILHKAFTGELTEKWRNEQGISISTWKEKTLQDVCSTKITDGTHKTPEYTEKDEGVPFISSKDVVTGVIDWSKIKYITKDLHEELYNRLAPQKGDVLLAKNGTTGVAAIVEDDRVFDLYVTLAVLRSDRNLIRPRYLLDVVNSPICKKQFDEHLTGIGVPNLHLRDIKCVTIPLPSLNEQDELVKIIDDLMKKEQEAKDAAEEIIMQIDDMKKSILAKAFRGELGTNDPTEPPVEIA